MHKYLCRSCKNQYEVDSDNPQLECSYCWITFCSDPDCYNCPTHCVEIIELFEDYNKVVQLIRNPPKPTQALIDALKKD